MLTRPKHYKFKLSTKTNDAAELSEVTHGILKASVDNKHVTLSINDVSFNTNVLPHVQYSVSSKDTRSGYTAHKSGCFPEQTPEAIDTPRGNCLNYASSTGSADEALRIVGHAVNLNTQEVLFMFTAHTPSDPDVGWYITVDDYVDHGIISAII